MSTTYYVSPTGNDSNAGTSPAAAWRMITRRGVRLAAHATNPPRWAGAEAPAHHIPVADSGVPGRAGQQETVSGQPLARFPFSSRAAAPQVVLDLVGGQLRSPWPR